jgi:hypothetical protein
LVNAIKRKSGVVYECEFCGFGYEFLENAELCEEYCDAHGSASPHITERAIYKPTILVMPVTA